jgi:hypothetical protein
VLFLLAAHLPPAYRGRAHLLYYSGNHAGVILAGLLLTGCVLRCVRVGLRWPAALAILAIGALCGFSDKLLLVQFVAPLILSLTLLGLFRLAPWRRLTPVATLLWAAAGLSFLTKYIFLKAGFQLLRAEGDFKLFQGFRPDTFLDHFQACTPEQPLTRWVLGMHLAAGFLLTIAWLRRRPTATEAPPDRTAVVLVVVALLAAPLCNLGAIVGTGMTENPAIDRYLHACFVLPYLASGIWLFLAPWRAVRVGGTVPLGVASFAIYLVSLYLPKVDWDRFHTRYPPIAQALDDMVRRHGPLRGIAGFWPSRSLSFLTHERVPIRSVNDIGGAYPHASGLPDYLSADPHDTSYPDYHFVLFAPDGNKMMPSFEAMLCEYGEPLEKITVGDHHIWRYERLAGRRWELFLRAQLAPRLRREWAYVAPVEPASLRTPKHNLTRWDRAAHVLLPRGHAVEVRFAEPITGKLLDISADYCDLYRLEFFRGAEPVATVKVPAVSLPGSTYDMPGMQSRLVPLPKACHDKPWDRVVVTPLIGDNVASLGHLFVYQRELPYRFDHPLAPGQQRRYEGEIFFGSEAPTVRIAADPAASGGRARQAAANHDGYFSLGPYCYLAPGRYRVDFALAVADPAAPGPVATIDVTADGGLHPLRSRQLDGKDFAAGGRYTRFSFTLDVREEQGEVEFRVTSHGKTAVSLDYIDLTCLSADAPDRQAEADNLYSRSR